MLERLFQAEAARLASPLKAREHAFTCGVVHALRVCAGIPEHLAVKLEEHHDIARRTAVRPDDPGTFLNTPFWQSYVEDTAEPEPEE